MKYRPTRSRSLPRPRGATASDSNSRRAFSIPPQASTQVRAWTRPRRPSSVPILAARTVRAVSSVSSSSALACSSTVMLGAWPSASRPTSPKNTGLRMKVRLTSRSGSNPGGVRAGGVANVPGANRCCPMPQWSRARSSYGASASNDNGQPLCGTQSRCVRSAGSRGMQPPPHALPAPPNVRTRQAAGSSANPVDTPRHRAWLSGSPSRPPLSSRQTVIALPANERASVIPAGPAPTMHRSTSISAGVVGRAKSMITRCPCAKCREGGLSAGSPLPPTRRPSGSGRDPVRGRVQRLRASTDGEAADRGASTGPITCAE